MVHNSRETIAANVRAEAARKRKTQADLAAMLGKSQQAVSRKWHGETPFTAEEMAALALGLGVPVSALIGEPERAA